VTALNDPNLWRSKAYIDGAWVEGHRLQTFAVLNPSSQERLVDVADCDGHDTQLAIEAANRALVSWRALLPAERSVILRSWHDLIIKHADDLGRIMTLEQGKPLAEAKGEVLYGAGFVDWYADEAKRINGDVLPTTHHDKRLMVLKQAIGVVAAITPWNFPSSMITRKCAPALAAGCTVVLKPSDLTPLSALALAELAGRAGMPAGVFNVITTQDAAAVGQVIA
jgi:succinate-semialdehyde dehydrogenase/glutarate-semialdehyde dehydrogenase